VFGIVVGIGSYWVMSRHRTHSYFTAAWQVAGSYRIFLGIGYIVIVHSFPPRLTI
jgi:hypothetical protein